MIYTEEAPGHFNMNDLKYGREIPGDTSYNSLITGKFRPKECLSWASSVQDIREFRPDWLNYRKLPLISPGLKRVHKGFWVGL